MAAMATFIPSSDLIPYLIFIISPIYRFVNDETIKEIGIDFNVIFISIIIRYVLIIIIRFFLLIGNSKQLGKEILDLVQKCVGTTQFHIVYNKVKQQVLEVRKERK